MNTNRNTHRYIPPFVLAFLILVSQACGRTIQTSDPTLIPTIPLTPSPIPTNTFKTTDTQFPTETGVPVLILSPTTTLILPTKTPIKPTPKSHKTYSETNVGISFDYPGDMTISTNIYEDKGKASNIEIYSAHSSGKTAIIYITTNEEPPHQLFPESRRLSDELLRVDAEYWIVNIDSIIIERGITIDEKSTNDAFNNIEITSWKGYKSTFYHANYSSTYWDDVYVKSAHIYTDEREILIVVLGILEPPITSNGTVEYIDDWWNNFLESLIIDY